MSGFTLRPPREDDIPSLIDLGVRMGAEVEEPTSMDADDFRHGWTAPGFDLERHARVADADGRAVAYTSLHIDGRDVRGGGAVLPEYRGRGIGSSILRWTIEAARAEPAVTTLYTGTNVRRPGALDLIESMGFTFTRTFFQMRHPDPASVEVPPLPHGIRIDTSLRGDALRDAIIVAHDGSFIDHWNFHPLRPEEATHHLEGPNADPELLFIAVAGDEVAGLNLCFLDRGEGFVRGVVGVLGTTRPYRGIGLGSALLRIGVHALAERGATEVVLGVDSENPTGALGLYERAGFERRMENRVYRLDVS